MRGLEVYVLGNDGHTELIVNVTEIEDTDEVKTQLGAEWTWESTETRIQPADEEGESGPTEWLVLNRAVKKAVVMAAA